MCRGSAALLVLALVLTGAVIAGAVSQNAEFPVGSYQSDPFTITFQEGGAFRVLHSSGAGVNGTYKISGDRIELTDKDGEFACQGPVGTYTWKADDNKLIFTVVEDECDGRRQALTSRALVRKS